MEKSDLINSQYEKIDSAIFDSIYDLYSLRHSIRRFNFDEESAKELDSDFKTFDQGVLDIKNRVEGLLKLFTDKDESEIIVEQDEQGYIL